MRSSLLRYAVALPAVLLLALGAVLLYPDRLLESIRPWLERVAADRLDARVDIGRITGSLAGGRLSVENLRIEREGELRIEVRRLVAGFTLPDLLASRLESLRLTEPSISITAAAPATGARPLPPEPPLTVRRLEVSGGRLQVQAAGRTWQVEGIEGAGALGKSAPFRLAARIGEGNGLPFAARGELAWGQSLAVTLEAFQWGERELLASPLTITFLETGATASGALRLDRFDSDQLATLSAAFGLAPPLPAGWHFILENPEFRLLLAGGLKTVLKVPGGLIEGGGLRFPLAQVTAELSGEDGEWSGEGSFRLAGAAGRVQGRFAGGRTAGTVHLALTDPLSFLRKLTGGSFPTLAGGIDLAAEFSLAGEEEHLHATLSGRPGIRPADFIADLAPLGAELELARWPAGFSGSGRLRLRGREILRLKGTPERLQIELLPVAGSELADLLPPARRPPLLAGATGIGGTALLAGDRHGGWSGPVRLRAATVPLPRGRLRQLQLDARAGWSGQGLKIRKATFSARLAGEGMPSGEIAAAGEGEFSGRGYRLRLDRLLLKGVEYLAPDGLSGLNGGHLEGRGTLTGRPGEGRVRLALTAAFGAGEVLRGAFYANLASLTGELALRGSVDPNAGQLQAERLEVTVPGVASVALHGSLGGKASEMAGELSLPDLKTLLAGPLGAALAAAHPALSGLQLAGGIDAGLVAQREDGGWRLAGELRPQGLDLSWPGIQLTLRGGRGRFPFDLRPSAGAAAESGEGSKGELTFQELHLGPAVLAGRSVSLTAAPNRFSIDSPLVFALAGGELHLPEAAVALGAAGLEIAARLRLQGVHLGELTRALGMTEMSGRLSADLGRIRYAGGTITSDGNLGINAFGGAILVRNLRLESLFSSYATYLADLDFTGIDLHQLTRTFAFGEINGVADGHVHGLRLFGKVPAAFEAVLETREHGRRNISVKALNNLTVISQGGLSGVLSKGLYRFIDFYRYRKIGIRCALKNDVFILEGTARPGSDRYLVYGGWLPPKIDIIAPAHAISFKEMLKRLQRIERTEVGTGKH